MPNHDDHCARRRSSMERSWPRSGVLSAPFVVLAAIALLSLAVAISLAGCGRKPAGAAAPAGMKTAGAGDSPAAAVTVARAFTGSIGKTVDVTGSLAALQDVVVGAKSAGKVAQVNLHEGDAVTAGEVVAVMDTSDLSSQVQQAEANLQSAITRQQQAIVQLQQARNQLQQSKTNLRWTDQTTAAALKVAKSGLATAQEKLSAVKEGARPQERKQAQDQVSIAKANYEKARADLKRYQDLFRQEAVSQSQLDQMQAAFDSAQAQYSSAQQALSLIQEGARSQDVRQAELAVQSAQDGLAKAQADRETVQLRADDVQTAKAGVSSAQAGVEAARAGVKQTRAALKIAQDALSYAYVRSPISGYVAERRAEPGQELGAGGAILRIVSPKSVYFEAVLSESQYEDIHVGQGVKVTVDALPGKVFAGRVSRILPVASAARSFTVRIDIPSDQRLRPQMFARGSILVATHREATLVPKDAVIYDTDSNRALVFVTTDGVAHERTVQTGYTNPEEVEVVSGIRPGEKVIVAGQSALQDGDKIRVQNG